MVKNYQGIVDVEDDAFVMKIDRLLVAGGERVAFEISGKDHAGPFHVAGTAGRADGGYYVAPDVPVKSTRGGHATIRFFRVDDHEAYCEVEGSFEQDGYDGSPWGFVGELDVLD